jgi:hypothetical protein
VLLVLVAVCDGGGEGGRRTLVLSDVELQLATSKVGAVELEGLAQRIRILEIDVGDATRAVGLPVPGDANGIPGQVATSLRHTTISSFSVSTFLQSPPPPSAKKN